MPQRCVCVGDRVTPWSMRTRTSEGARPGGGSHGAPVETWAGSSVPPRSSASSSSSAGRGSDRINSASNTPLGVALALVTIGPSALVYGFRRTRRRGRARHLGRLATSTASPAFPTAASSVSLRGDDGAGSSHQRSHRRVVRRPPRRRADQRLVRPRSATICCRVWIVFAPSRPNDIAIRYGGDEFVLLCPDITNLISGERTRARCSSHRGAVPDGRRVLELRVIGGRHRGRRSLEEVLADADAAMHQARKKGPANS